MFFKRALRCHVCNKKIAIGATCSVCGLPTCSACLWDGCCQRCHVKEIQENLPLLPDVVCEDAGRHPECKGCLHGELHRPIPGFTTGDCRMLRWTECDSKTRRHVKCC